jgi:hypothetical protein
MPILSPARRVATFDDLELAGDYTGPHMVTVDREEEKELQYVWFLLPIHNGADKYDHHERGDGLHGIASPPWVFRECGDGSLEVRDSIACGRRESGGEYWHGYLDEGNTWRQV